MDRPTKRFIVTYQGAERDPGMGTMTWGCYAYSAEHAEQKFLDSGADEEGWEVVSVDRPKDGWGKVTTRLDRES